MKVFISWSGPLSHKVALKLRDWLPLVVATAAPYVSSEDIDKGSRWAQSVSGELEVSAFGIICVTSDNQSNPWIQFEAGALSKKLDTGRVSPLLIGLRPAQLNRDNPLLQFQATEVNEDDLSKLTRSMARVSQPPLAEGIVQQQLRAWWPSLREAVTEAINAQIAESSDEPMPAPTRLELMVEELLTLARTQQRVLGSLSREDPDVVATPVLSPVEFFIEEVNQLTKISALRRNEAENKRLESAVNWLTGAGDQLQAHHTEALANGMAAMRRDHHLLGEVGLQIKKAAIAKDADERLKQPSDHPSARRDE